VLERPLRLAAVVTSAIVLVSFGLFAANELRTASAESRARIAAADASNDPDAAARLERIREREQSALHEALDDVNDVLTAPFDFAAGSSPDIWVQRGVPSLLALVFFGAGLGFLARYSKGSVR
jgi:hypothetical protein